ncbi:MAG TPA: acyl-ACP--UDP-N-acetylglucosamine O-acyltransferase [Thermoguttaceae bacterium]|nr:acyl-ACP--UDP-N-acetylglucosamine O-acyltransferase [Thermoguttaceae bacterium]
MSIHPSAVVSPAACIDPDVHIGPFCFVEPNTTIGRGCILESHVVVKSGTTLGTDNHVFEGTILGGLPQHVRMPENPGTVRIGSGNTIRENVTVHRALESEGVTRIGDHNLLMINAHVAHDCRLGDHTIITNNVMLAGHVSVEDRAYLSGAAAAHQFCRIGTLAMVGGQAHLVKDVPPFVTVDGLSSLVVGLNHVGLRRAGFDLQAIRQLKAAYRVIYRSGLSWAEIIERLQAEFSRGPAAAFGHFISATTRGITPARRLPPGATLKIRDDTRCESDVRTKAG